MHLIPTVNVDNFFKCPMWIEAKYAQKTFKDVAGRKTELPELVYSHLEDFM